MTARRALYPASGRDLARKGQRVVAYYPGWTARGQHPYEVARIPAERLTHPEDSRNFTLLKALTEGLVDATGEGE